MLCCMIPKGGEGSCPPKRDSLLTCGWLIAHSQRHSCFKLSGLKTVLPIKISCFREHEHSTASFLLLFSLYLFISFTTESKWDKGKGEKSTIERKECFHQNWAVSKASCNPLDSFMNIQISYFQAGVVMTIAWGMPWWMPRGASSIAVGQINYSQPYVWQGGKKWDVTSWQKFGQIAVESGKKDT